MTVTGRKSTLSDSGSSWRPRYPGFMVMKDMQPSTWRKVSMPLKRKEEPPARMPSRTDFHWMVHTESTSASRRLNSSKQPHEPDEARPLKMSAIVR